MRISSRSPSANVRPAARGERVDVELDLLGEEPVDGAAQIEQPVDRLLALAAGQIPGDLVDEQAVDAGVT